LPLFEMNIRFLYPLPYGRGSDYMDLQRIHIKMLTDARTSLPLEPFLNIFGRWRHEKNHPAGWVDLADYAHVPRGMGIVLVGFQGNFSFDMSDDKGRSAPGLLYVSKKGLTGTFTERIAAVLKTALDLCQRLVAEKEFPQGVHLRTDALEIRFPDRLVTPNTKETYVQLCPAVLQVLDKLYGAGTSGRYQVVPAADPAEVLGCSVRAQTAEPLATLLQRLAGSGSL
jgi:hypothetical protein